MMTTIFVCLQRHYRVPPRVLPKYFIFIFYILYKNKNNYIIFDGFLSRKIYFIIYTI